MADNPRTIKVTPATELRNLLAEAATMPLILDNDGELYRLAHVERAPKSIWDDYEPEQAKQAVRAATGAWADMDTEAALANIYRAREEGSRPASRL